MTAHSDMEFFNHLAKFLTDKERLELFDILCNAVVKRGPERISLELGIKKQNVYRYMPHKKNRLTPNSETTAKVIIALIRWGRSKQILPFVEVALQRMHRSYKLAYAWLKRTRRIFEKDLYMP